jgi:ankyrin repeat protein
LIAREFYSLTASENGHKDIVKYLLSKDADVNDKDIDGRTALHLGE